MVDDEAAEPTRSVSGFEFDEDDLPPKDVITEGATALINGGDSSPLAQYNAAFNTLRKRLAVPVLVGASAPPQSEEAPTVAQGPAAGRESTDGLPKGDSQNDLDNSTGELEVVNDPEEFGSEASGEAESEPASDDEWESDRSSSEEESILGEETLVEMEEDMGSPGGELTLEGVGDVALEMDVEEAWEDDGDEIDEVLDS